MSSSMPRLNVRVALLLVAFASSAVTFAPLSAGAQSQFTPLRWRSIGPFRASRSRPAAGHPSHPYTFYTAQVNGGVWKTTDAGRTWFPIFDDQPSQSIGVVAIAPSDPNTLYVGSGEGLHRPDLSYGDGVYKSTDAGKTWTNTGLRDAQQIAGLAVDPRDPNRVFVAALGHPYNANPERGVYRTLDGGRTWTPVLQKNENVGANDVDIDPSNPQVVYANLWEARQGPWENAAWAGNGGGLFKSSDGGATWKQLTNGLPPTTNQVNLSIAPSNPNRLFAAVASNGPPATVGLYRSDDAGETWTRITTDNRPGGRIGGGDLPVPLFDPKDQDKIIMLSTVSWISRDGGRTWQVFKSAPGGEDYQGGWINPNDTNIILLVADQGAVVSLNGGESWSSWYNQPTAQLYHVAADNAFPYRVCSGQQESGSACVASRGNYGAISDRDWMPVGVDEYGYVAPDPLDDNIVYGGRAVTRFDRRTGQVSTVGPLAGRAFAPGASPYRQVRTQPVVFSEADKRMLLFGNNYLWKTLDGGRNWTQIAGDLTRKTWKVPASVGKFTDTTQVAQRGVIYTIGPSPISVSTIWFGTDDGLIYRTFDGGRTWKDVTPPEMGAWWKVFMVDAGRFDVNTAYAAVNTLRLGDMNPYFFKTHDGGRTWANISALPAGAGPANAIREDPKVKGLLFAATEKSVYMSPDDGATWTQLRMNLPATSVRDLIVKDDDIVVATHGRGFWILDDITPLRQLARADSATRAGSSYLFRPQAALRVRPNTSTDMPWPKEEPVGENPPDGAPINFMLAPGSHDSVRLEIIDARGRVVRTYSSNDSLPFVVPPAAQAPVPLYWYKQPTVLPKTGGAHRFFWDVHYQNLPVVGGGGVFGGGGGLPISAIPGRSAPAPRAPWVAPGNYRVRLTVDGVSQTQPLVVRQDPRVKTSALAMNEVYALTDSMYFTLVRLQRVLAAEPAPVVADTARPGPRTPRGAYAALSGLLMTLQAADVPATATQRGAIADALTNANAALRSRPASTPSPNPTRARP